MDAVRRQIGAGLSAGGAKTIGYTVVSAQMAASFGVLGAVIGALAGGDAKSAGIGGAIGAVVGGIFGAVAVYETAQGVSSAAAAVGA